MEGPGSNQPQQPYNPNQTPPAWGSGPPIPPPVPPTQPPMGGGQIPNFPHRPEVTFDALGEAWGYLQQQMGVWIPTMLIYMMLIYGFSFLGQMITQSLVGGSIAAAGNNQGIPVGAIGTILVMSLISGLVQLVLSSFLTGGLFRMAINHVRGQAIAISDLFSASDVILPIIGASLLITLASGIGMIFCIVPGLVIYALLMFAIPLIVDQRIGAMEAMSQSWNALKGQAVMATLFMIVAGLAAISGVLLCGIGMIVTLPLAFLSIAILYRNFFLGQQQAYTGGYSTPPGSYPPVPPVGGPM